MHNTKAKWPLRLYDMYSGGELVMIMQHLQAEIGWDGYLVIQYDTAEAIVHVIDILITSHCI